MSVADRLKKKYSKKKSPVASRLKSKYQSSGRELGRPEIDFAKGLLGDIVQNFFLESADDLIGVISEESAKDFDTLVREFRKQEPSTAIISGLLTPSILDAVSGGLAKLGKLPQAINKSRFIRPVIQAGGESSVAQLGDTGEVSGTQTAIASGLGAAMGIVNKALRGRQIKGTQSSSKDVGRMEDAGLEMIKHFKARTGRDKPGFEAAEELYQKLEKQGFFGKGVERFDPDRAEFVTKAGKKAGPSITKPFTPETPIELSKRARMAESELGSRLGEVYDQLPQDSRSMSFLDESGSAVFDTSKKGQGFVNRAGIMDELADRPTKFTSQKQADDYDKMVDQILGFEFKEGGELSTPQLTEFIRKLDSNIEFDQLGKKVNTPKNAIFENMAGAARSARDKAFDELPQGDKIRGLNKDFSEMADVVETTGDKATKSFFGQKNMIPNIPVGAASPSPVGKAAAGSQMFRTMYQEPSQEADLLLKKTQEKFPFLYESMKGLLPRSAREGAEALVPEEGGSSRSPQAIQNQLENLPMLLNQKRFDRSTDAILENPTALQAKLAQMEGTPEYMNFSEIMGDTPDRMVGSAIERSSHRDISRMLPQLTEFMPSAFKYDKYKRINEVIPPPMRAMAVEDLRVRDDMPNSLKVELESEINKSGKLSQQYDLEDQ